MSLFLIAEQRRSHEPGSQFVAKSICFDLTPSPVFSEWAALRLSVFACSRVQNAREDTRGGQSVSLHYPSEVGVLNDFFACIIRDEYGLRHRLLGVRTILDIGANIGFFSIGARARYPRAIIHAYEPNPRVLPFLRSNALGIGVEIYPEAVGARSGFANMIDAGDSNQAKTCTSESGEIPMVSFDQAIQRLGGSVDLLKLDCEGAEWDLFQLADAWKHVHNVRMEYHLFHGETVSQVEQTVRELGFDVIYLCHEGRFGMIWATSRMAN